MSQGSFQVPVTGSESATTYAGQCNTAWQALASKNSGASSPMNGPSSLPMTFEDWMDLSNASFPVWRLFDGANWDRIGTLDIANSNWLPKLGGGNGSIASAATCDLGSQPQTRLSITGTTTITSFGTSAAVGEMKICFPQGQFVIANSANIICPGAQNITTNVGDNFTALYDGASVWEIVQYNKAAAPPGGAKRTGEVFMMYGTGTIAGAARCNGGTIGNTGSGGTEMTGPACFSLYSQIWTTSAGGDPETVISGGGRGASAAADWAALKTITLPDFTGRLPGMIDDGVKNRLTNTTMSPNGTTLGAIGGAQTTTLSSAQLPTITPTITLTYDAATLNQTNSITPVGVTGTYNSGTGANPTSTGGAGGFLNTGTGNAFTGTQKTLTAASSSFGSGSAINKMPPIKLLMFYIAL